MQFEIGSARAKSIARAIQKRCKTAGAKIAYGQALDGLAEGLGYRDWNTLSAHLDTAGTPAHETPAAERPDDASPAIVVPGHVHSDDHVHSCDFDASVYLAAHSDDAALAETLRRLFAEGFEDNYTVDHFVRSADTGDGAIDALRDHCRAHDGIGFSASIDRELTLAWIRTRRPGAYAQAKDLVQEDDREDLEQFEALLLAAPHRIFEDAERLAIARAMTEGNQPGFIDHPGATYLHSVPPSQMLSLHPETTPETSGPAADLTIRAQARADDGSVATAFDAAPYLAGLTRPRLAETLRDLAREGWGCDYTADEIARALSDRPGNELLERVIDRSADIDPATGETTGFTVEIEPADVVAWLKVHDLSLLRRLVGERVIETDDPDVRRQATVAKAARLMSGPSPKLASLEQTGPSLDDTDPGADLGPNTRIEYTYRDASNYKASKKLVLMGPLSDNEIAEIQAELDEGAWFVPGQVGLEDLQDSFTGCLSWWDPEQDHVWHELETLERTDAKADTMMTARELLEAFRDVVWDDRHEPDCYAEMLERYRAHHGTPDAPREPLSVWGDSEREAVDGALAELAQHPGHGPHPMLVYIRRSAFEVAEPVDARGYRFTDGARTRDVVALMRNHGLEVHGAFAMNAADGDWDTVHEEVAREAARLGLRPAPEAAKSAPDLESNFEAVVRMALRRFADAAERNPEALKTFQKAWPDNLGEGPLVIEPRGSVRYEARCYAFIDRHGHPARFVLIQDDGALHLRGAHDADYGRITWGEAESMLFAAASQWGMTPA